MPMMYVHKPVLSSSEETGNIIVLLQRESLAKHWQTGVGEEKLQRSVRGDRVSR
jgi:hypothetical protein